MTELVEQPEQRPRGRWKTALLLFGSALVGASAVALWNRRAVAHLQSQKLTGDATAGEPAIAARTEEEIF